MVINRFDEFESDLKTLPFTRLKLQTREFPITNLYNENNDNIRSLVLYFNSNKEIFKNPLSPFRKKFKPLNENRSIGRVNFPNLEILEDFYDTDSLKSINAPKLNYFKHTSPYHKPDNPSEVSDFLQTCPLLKTFVFTHPSFKAREYDFNLETIKFDALNAKSRFGNNEEATLMQFIRSQQTSLKCLELLNINLKVRMMSLILNQMKLETLKCSIYQLSRYDEENGIEDISMYENLKSNKTLKELIIEVHYSVNLGSEDLGSIENIFSSCTVLEKLMISCKDSHAFYEPEKQVFMDGVKGKLLYNISLTLPSLKYLFLKNFNNASFPAASRKLEHVETLIVDSDGESLLSTIITCPNVKKLNISQCYTNYKGKDLGDENLIQILNHAKSLQEINIANFGPYRFSNVIADTLISYGKSLRLITVESKGKTPDTEEIAKKFHSTNIKCIIKQFEDD